MGGISEQITLAMRQLTETGDHNLSEAIIYEPENAAVITGKRAIFRRGEGTAEPVMGMDYEKFEADITVYADDLGTIVPRAGDQVRLADLTEVWRILGIRSQLPGGYILRAERKILRRTLVDD